MGRGRLIWLSSSGGKLRPMFSEEKTCRQLDILGENHFPTKMTHRPKVIGPIDPFAYRSPSAKQSFNSQNIES